MPAVRLPARRALLQVAHPAQRRVCPACAGAAAKPAADDSSAAEKEREYKARISAGVCGTQAVFWGRLWGQLCGDTGIAGARRRQGAHTKCKRTPRQPVPLRPPPPVVPAPQSWRMPRCSTTPSWSSSRPGRTAWRSACAAGCVAVVVQPPFCRLHAGGLAVCWHASPKPVVAALAADPLVNLCSFPPRRWSRWAPTTRPRLRACGRWGAGRGADGGTRGPPLASSSRSQQPTLQPCTSGPLSLTQCPAFPCATLPPVSPPVLRHQEGGGGGAAGQVGAHPERAGGRGGGRGGSEQARSEHASLCGCIDMFAPASTPGRP